MPVWPNLPMKPDLAKNITRDGLHPTRHIG
jgi:hypothetical protein